MANDFPVFDEDDLSEFTGRPSVIYPTYVAEAIDQATFLIKIRTKIKKWPTDPDLQRLLKYAIMDLANIMYLEREYDKIKANPVSSETIGNYSWSKSNAAQTSRYKSWPTGIEWLDILLEYLADLDNDLDPMMDHGSVHVFERDGVYQLNDGESWVLGPSQIRDKRYELPDPSYWYNTDTP